MRYMFLSKTNPTPPAEEEDYNRWYDDVHLGQVLDLPGFISGERFVYGERQLAGTPEPSHKYLALYEVETDDLEASLTALTEKLGTPQLAISSAVDFANAQGQVFAALGNGPSYRPKA